MGRPGRRIGTRRRGGRVRTRARPARRGCGDDRAPSYAPSRPAMTSTRVVAPIEAPPFRDAFQEVRREFDVPAQFPPECEAEAKEVSARGPVVPAGASTDRSDA